MTPSGAAQAEIAWEPPSKGDWRGLHDHFLRALTPEYMRVLATGMADGEAINFADYGLPARTIQPAFVHGRVFVTAAALIGPASNVVPPKWALWLAVRAVPAYRRRAAAARRAMAERRWLAETERWYAVERPAWQDRNAAIDAIDPGRLDDSSLTNHLIAARNNIDAGYLDHFRLHGADLLPTAMFLTRASDWGIDSATATGLLTGFSPASRGAADLPQWRLVTGYDLDDRCAAELPPLAATAAPAPSSASSAADDALRARVPAADRAEWDRLLADARATYGLRDDNGLWTAAWPMGLLRRAMLEAGRRLHARGALAEIEHAVEVTVDELVALLGGANAPTAVDVTERAAERRRLSAAAPPASLGPPQELPMSALPPAMRLITRALLTVRDLGITPPGAREPLRGVGIGDVAVTGRACVALDPIDAFARFEPGDILVTRGTCPAWNSILALAGGVVTEEGGPLSHAAVIARELNLPALVGAADAVALIGDGATVELDPRAGRVTIRSL
jgi:pyruvate,water dikinase